MRFVPIKNEEQQDVQALHRVREQLVKSRTALANQITGLFSERGIVVARAIARLRAVLPVVLEEQSNRLSALMASFWASLPSGCGCLMTVCGSTTSGSRAFASRTNAVGGWLVKVEGVGPLVATALVAAIGNARQFTNGGELSAWLGLVPREHSSGNRTVLLGLSKRGNRYLRTLLIHGGRATARVAERKRDARSIWLSRLKLGGGPNVAAVALANKTRR